MAVFLPVDMNDLDFVARANSSLRYNLAEDVSTQPQDGSSHIVVCTCVVLLCVSGASLMDLL